MCFIRRLDTSLRVRQMKGVVMIFGYIKSAEFNGVL